MNEYPRTVAERQRPVMSENRRDYFFWNRAAFEQNVRKRVCPKCEYSNGDVCRTPDPRGCALFRHLPEMVVVAQHLPKPMPGEYARVLAEAVRWECLNPETGAPCRLNDTLRCGLDQFLPSLLRAIRETDRMLENRPGFGNYDY